MMVWYLVRNDKGKPDRATGIVHPFYSRAGIPFPFSGDEVRSSLGTPVEIDADLAQELNRLIEVEGLIASRGGVTRQELSHASQSRAGIAAEGE